MTEFRLSDDDRSKRDIPSFIEPRPPLIQHPFMRPRPQKGTNLMELFEEDSVAEEPELVQVYLRMRPCNVPSNLYEIRSDKCLITSLDTTTSGHGRRTQQNVSRMYTFSKIFTAQATQKELFEQVVKENLKKLPEGHSYTLLTYGASGSGKTYTLMGTVNAPGLVPRSLEYVFKLVDAAQKPLYKPSDTGADMLSDGQQEFELQWVKRLRQVSAPLRDKYRRMSAQLHNDLTDSNFDLSNRTKHYVWVSFFEIYNEAIYDLLAPPSSMKRTKLRIREDSAGNVYVKDAIQAFVRSGEEAYDVMAAGKQNLSVAATGVHAHSSRSHCIFTITMLTQSEGEIRTSHVRLCDLAGCERARATRNTGARMQESRAINASLHVLERCLHTLRRKQRQHPALVPYRESKLTRLLGSGLSGSRGEAVSMVVTLNPAPQFAQETKHVLSLAAVATDIQINNTMFAASTLSLESSCSQDSTMETSAEIMKLRADNELLHFELMQAQARNKELIAFMDAKQKENSETMQELVEAAKANTKDYYETQIKMLMSDIEDLKEEYESKLAEVSSPVAPPSNTGTPTRFLQSKVNQLMTQIAVLEEKLAVEKLARDRAEKEVEHLRTCLEERDVEEKTIEKTMVQENEVKLKDDEIVITDSEDEEDPFNESLEPVFKKAQETSKFKPAETNCYDSEADKSSDAEKYEDCDTTSKNSVPDETESEKLDGDSTVTEINDFSNKINESFDNSAKIDVSNNNVSEVDIEKSLNESISNENSVNESKKRIARGTYFVKDTDSFKESLDDLKDKSMETDKDNLVEEISLEAINKFQDSPKDKVESIKSIVSGTALDKILKSVKKQESIDNSLTQFEKLEMAANEFNDSNHNKDKFVDLQNFIEKRTYIDGFTKFDNIVTDVVENNIEIDYTVSKASVERSINKAKPMTDKINDLRSIVDEAIAKVPLKTIEKDVELTKPVKNDIVNPILKITEGILVSNPIKQKRTYFDNIARQIEIDNKIVVDVKLTENEERSPSIVKDDFDNYFEPSTSKRLLGDGIFIQKPNKKHESVDLFESDSPHFKLTNIIQDNAEENQKIPDNKLKLSNVELVRKSIEKLVLEQKTRHEKQMVEKLESPIVETAKAAVEMTKAAVQTTKTAVETTDVIADTKENEQYSNDPATKKDLENVSEATQIEQPKVTITEQTFNETQNTTAEFENIYKDISKHRDTEFDIIATQIDNATDKDDSKPETVMNKNEEIKYNLRKKGKSVLNTSDDKKTKVDNLDHKKSKVDNLDDRKIKVDNLENKKTKVDFTEILAESSAKCEMKPKRNLRLRRRKNPDEETHSDPDQESRSDKLKDLLNLKKEFSDVTMGLPAVKKVVKDIPSPEKRDEENVPPPMGIQSCPAASVTRSRRKLFTPRAEPLEESLSQTGDSNERVYVPRPSYHRGRARRKL